MFRSTADRPELSAAARRGRPPLRTHSAARKRRGRCAVRGEGTERQFVESRLERIRANWWQLMRYTKNLTFLTPGYDQLAGIFPVLVAAPRYFSGAISLGVLTQIGNAFGQVQGALSWFVDSYGALASWKATTDRLLTFQDAMQAARAPGQRNGWHQRRAEWRGWGSRRPDATRSSRRPRDPVGHESVSRTRRTPSDHRRRRAPARARSSGHWRASGPSARVRSSPQERSPALRSAAPVLADRVAARGDNLSGVAWDV